MRVLASRNCLHVSRDFCSLVFVHVLAHSTTARIKLGCSKHRVLVKTVNLVFLCFEVLPSHGGERCTVPLPGVMVVGRYCHSLHLLILAGEQQQRQALLLLLHCHVTRAQSAHRILEVTLGHMWRHLWWILLGLLV